MKRSVRILRNSLLVLLLVLAIMPLLLSELASQGLKYLLREQGAEAIQVEHLWFNPYTARLELEGLAWRIAAQDYKLGAVHAQMGLRELLSRKILVQELKLQGFGLYLHDQDKTLTVNGLVLPAATAETDAAPASAAEPWAFAIEQLQIQDVELDLRLGELHTHFRLDQLAIAGLDTTSSEAGTIRLDLQNDLRQGEATHISTGIALQSDIQLNRPGDGWQIRGNTRLTLRELGAVAAGMSMQTKQLQIEADVDARYVAADDYSLSATVSLGQFDPSEAGADLLLEDLREGADTRVATAVTLQSSIELGHEQDTPQLTAEAQLVLRDLGVAAVGLSLQAAQLEVAARLAAELGSATNYAVSASSSLQQLDVKPVAATTELLRMKTLRLSDLQLQSAAPERIQVSGLRLEGLGIGNETAAYPQMVTAAVVQLQDMVLHLPSQSAALRASLASLELAEGEISLLRDAEGGFPQVTALQSALSGGPATAVATDDTATTTTTTTTTTTKAPPDPAATGATSGSPAGAIQIAEVLVAPPVKLHFQDKSVKPALKETVSFEEFRLSNLHLDGSQSAQLKARLGLSHDARLSVTGDINPLNLNTDLVLDLRDYQLLQASGYAQQATGYALEAGTLNLDSNIRILDQQMDLQNEIFIDQIHLRTASEDQVRHYSQKLSMPLDQALDLLRNNKDEIKLELPVKGPLNDPNLHLDEIINKALGGALKKATVSALKYMLQPYSTIFTVVKFAGEQASRLRLQPMAFASGSPDLDAEARGYAGKIAGILDDRDSVQLKLCGITNGADAEFLRQDYLRQQASQQPTSQQQSAQDSTVETPPQQSPAPVGLSEEALAERLHELGQARSQALRSYLLSELQVNSAQLLVCLPDHRRAEDAVAGVELLL